MRRLSIWQAGVAIFILIVVAGILLDSWPLYRRHDEIEAIISEKQQILLALQAREHADLMSLPPMFHASSSLLQLMTAAGQANGMNLISFLHVPLQEGQGIFRERAIGVFSGTYRQTIAMMRALSDATSGVLLRDFTLQPADQGDYRLQAEVLLSNRVTRRQIPEQGGQLRNAFCAGDDAQPVNQDEDATVLRVDSVSRMQMLAFLRQSADVVAWVRLSDGHLVSLQRGDIIGREQAVVKRIDQTGVTLIDALGRRYYIKSLEGAN